MRTDVYQQITDHIVAALEQGVRPWHQPWNAEHSAGRITRPLRGNGVPSSPLRTCAPSSFACLKVMGHGRGVASRDGCRPQHHDIDALIGEILSFTPTRSSAPRPTPRPARKPSAPSPS